MASASTWQLSAMRHSSTFSSNRNTFAGLPRPSNLPLPRVTFNYSTTIASARRRGNLDRAASSSTGKQKIKKKVKRDDSRGGDDIDEDAFEALFKQLEEDLKNDESTDDVDEDMSEEDFIKLEKEIEEVLAEDEDLADLLNSMSNDSDDEGGDIRGEIEEQDETPPGDVAEEKEEVPEEPKLQLRGWQLRRLASALKKGRRKTSIKDLVAEIGVDRAIVLELLRNPPPSLLMMSSALPDTLDQNSINTRESETTEVSSLDSTEPTSTEDTSKTPIHVLQTGWTARKRLKKVHLDTLERVYRRSKRPTNAIVSSIVQVTNLPRKRIVKWFEDRRAEEGVTELHPTRNTYRRSTTSGDDSHPAFTQLSNVGSSSSSESTVPPVSAANGAVSVLEEGFE